MDIYMNKITTQLINHKKSEKIIARNKEVEIFYVLVHLMLTKSILLNIVLFLKIYVK